MARKIELARGAELLDGMLLKAARLHQARRAAGLLGAARREAVRIVREARRDGAEYRRQGFCQGYGDGVQAGAAEVGRVLTALADARARLRQELEREAAALFETLLPQPEVGLSLLRDWLARTGGEPEPVELHLPRAWQFGQKRLGLAQPAAATLRVCLHDGNHFAIRQGDRVHEFAPDEAAPRLTAAVLARIRFDALTQDCAARAAEARDRLARQWRVGTGDRP